MDSKLRNCLWFALKCYKCEYLYVIILLFKRKTADVIKKKQPKNQVDCMTIFRPVAWAAYIKAGCCYAYINGLLLFRQCFLQFEDSLFRIFFFFEQRNKFAADDGSRSMFAGCLESCLVGDAESHHQ